MSVKKLKQYAKENILENARNGSSHVFASRFGGIAFDIIGLGLAQALLHKHPDSR